jgi:nitroreductase
MTQPEAPMSLTEAIYERRSVRSYASQRLDHTVILSLLKAAVWAPTAVHEEPWKFVILQDKSALRQLSDRAKPLFLEEAHRAHLDRGGHTFDSFAQPDFNIFYNAGTLILICAKPMGPFVVADCWLAAENLMLAACAMGLGTCVIGSAVPALNTAEIKAELGVPAECTVIAPIIVGVPSGETPRTTRKEPEILTWK